MEYKILNKIESPDNVKKLTREELGLLCSEIRSCLIETVSKNGGHLASNLGTVELTVALHRVFSSPEDAILFDVGHQSYTHKLLTGRFEKFSSLRKFGGISGFMNPDESEHDPYISGHSSNAVSAAYGIYKAKAINGEKGTAVAVIGDGAMTGGMAYEALNNIGADNSKFIVILNDNKMSMSKNVGALARHLTKIRSKTGYHNFKFRFGRFLNSIPLIGSSLYKFFDKIKTMLKIAVYHSNVFEALGFNYLGPVDGHDLVAVENILTIAKKLQKPTLVHIVTVKGKGYSFAETDPGSYHGVSKFDAENGICGAKNTSYSDVAGETLVSMAKEDTKICAITAAMADGTGLNTFSKLYKNRFFDVGIAEEHAVTFAAGLAKGGMKPYFMVYSSFLQRSYDQLLHDVAIQKLPVRICVDRAGFVGEDGRTHQGLFDVSFLSSIPDITVYSPASFDELKGTLLSTTDISAPTVIRYPRGQEISNCYFAYSGKDYDIFGSNGKIAAVSYGRLSYNVLSAVTETENADFIKLNRIIPINDEVIDLLMSYDKVMIFEEGIKSGSVAEKISSALSESEYNGSVSISAVNGEFVAAADVNTQLDLHGLSKEKIINKLRGN
ncbi:MAG: 1-deoxy-D-xylulose-5-phosphate synthase [Acutalibacteraceae bacterium]|nr:1-deoxy-D-xylulose-5-phosphate synthase [Acutalibacteraceae bacterium]